MATTKKQNKPSAFMKPVALSEALSAIVGKGPMPRTEVVKKLWEYIKKHDLQDPQDKRLIRPDSKLSKVLGHSAISMLKIPGKLSQHLNKEELTTPKR